jgi:very-short-patch-repair endonuclease
MWPLPPDPVADLDGTAISVAVSARIALPALAVVHGLAGRGAVHSPCHHARASAHQTASMLAVASRLPPHWVPEVAHRQDGVFTAAQAIRAGATPAQVRHRRERGTWRRVVGMGLVRAGLEDTPGRKIQAAGLTWPGSVVAFETAAVFHRLPIEDDGLVHALVQRAPRPRAGMVPHQYDVVPGDVLAVGAGAVTTMGRTVLDCLGRVGPEQAERLATWAVTRELLTARGLENAIAARAGKRGTRALRRALAEIGHGALSAAERRLHRLLIRARIPGWEADVRIHDARGIIGRVDVLFPAAKVAIEIDGYAYHSRTAFQADRTKQNRLVAAGYTVLRFTWADLTDRPGDVIATIRRATSAP